MNNSIINTKQDLIGNIIKGTTSAHESIEKTEREKYSSIGKSDMSSEHKKDTFIHAEEHKTKRHGIWAKVLGVVALGAMAFAAKRYIGNDNDDGSACICEVAEGQ